MPRVEMITDEVAAAAVRIARTEGRTAAAEATGISLSHVDKLVWAFQKGPRIVEAMKKEMAAGTGIPMRPEVSETQPGRGDCTPGSEAELVGA